MQQAEVHVKGPGGGRESAIRAINIGGHPRHDHPRHDAHPPQRLPPAEAATRIVFRCSVFSFQRSASAFTEN